MSEISLFEHPQFGSVRVIERVSGPWFVAADVCRCLGLDQVTRALAGLDDDEKQFLLGEQFAESQSSCTLTNSNPQENSCSPANAYASGINIISEAGLYSLVLRSRKPEAKEFKRWITHEILPEIRKNGMYANMSYPDALRKLADEVEDKEKAQAALVQEQSAHCMTKNSLDDALRRLGYYGSFSGVCTQSWLYDFFDGSKHGFFTGLGLFLSSTLRDYGKYDLLTRLVPVRRRNGVINQITVYHNIVWDMLKYLLVHGMIDEQTRWIGKFVLPRYTWSYLPALYTREEVQRQLTVLASLT